MALERMKSIADQCRPQVEASVRRALVGSSLQKVTYAVTYWQLVFLGDNETQLEAAEILLPDQFEPEDDSEKAVLVGSRLLALANTATVESVVLHACGDLVIRFSAEQSIRIVGQVPGVDWTWSIKAPSFEFTCDGPLSD